MLITNADLVGAVRIPGMGSDLQVFPGLHLRNALTGGYPDSCESASQRTNSQARRVGVGLETALVSADVVA